MHGFWHANLESLHGDQACFLTLPQTSVCVSTPRVGGSSKTLATIGKIFLPLDFFRFMSAGRRDLNARHPGMKDRLNKQ